MFKAKEVAKQLGISEQAVYKKFRLSAEIQQYISIIDGVKCINEEGLNLLRNNRFKGLETKFKSLETEFNLNDNDSIKNEKDDKKINNELKDLYEKLLESKDSEIINLREENKKLLQIIEQQNKLLLNQQVLQEKVLSTTELMLLEKRKTLEERQEKFREKKYNWINKLFSRN